MTIRPIPDPLPGERLLAVAPRPDAGQVASWRRRINGFAGRALSADALTREQQQRAGRLALLAQALSPGVVAGLEAALQGTGENARIQIAAGQGLGATGEDVRLAQPLDARLRDIALFESAAESDTPEGGALMPRNLGRTLGELIALGADLPHAMLLLIVPANAERAARGDASSPCERDPEDDAYLDLRRVDGARLALYPWPTDVLAMPAPGARWRNRLARALFMAEKDLAPHQLAPWQTFGVPVALLGFDAAYLPLFADHHAAARPGGRPKRREALIPDAGHPYLWEARMRQFAEHLVEALADAPGVAEAAREFQHLPPAGLLPRDAVDFPSSAQRFLPASWTVDAVPVPLEQLDMILAEAATLADFNTDLADRAQLLVPVPQSVFEPRLLQTETVDNEFYTTLDEFLARRGEQLARRVQLRASLTALARAASGAAPVFPDPDPLALEPETIPQLTLDPPELDHGTRAGGAGRESIDLAELATRLEAGTVKASFTRGSETIRLADIGIVRYAEELKRLADEADDKVALGFDRSRLDIRKVRNLALGGEKADADRLGVSSALNTLIKPETAQFSALAFDAFKIKLDAKAFAAPAATQPATTIRGAGLRSAGLSAGFETRAIVNDVALGAISARPIETTVGFNDVLLIQDGFKSELFAGTVADIPAMPISIDAQIAQPPAVETHGQATGGRFDAVNAIGDMAINLSGLGFFGIPAAEGSNQAMDLEALKTGKSAVLANVLSHTYDRVTGTTVTEGSYLSRALLTIDETLATWRLVASRVAQYRAAIADCQATLARVQNHARALSTRLAEIETELAEARHDVSVARALIAEEEARVAKINARRARLLAEEVKFVAYRRPRIAQVLDELPERALDPAFTVDPVPACRDANLAPPPELEAMLAVARQSPPAWFPEVDRALDRIDRFEHLTHLLDFARARPAFILPVFAAASVPASTVIAARMQRVVALRAATALVAIKPSWIDARAQASQSATLADVVNAGAKEAAKAANETLDALGDIGACLYRGFSATPARLRLAWAEALSEHDAPVDLGNLSRLTGFAGIDFTLRRTLQSYVDALYARIDPASADARALISDLVRVCLLAAAHAPVKRIVAARVKTETPATPGSRVPLTLDPKLARIGMRVNFYAGSQVVAQGVLEDVNASAAAARVVSAFSVNARIAANAVAQLMD
jgi:hypothetical protein